MPVRVVWIGTSSVGGERGEEEDKLCGRVRGLWVPSHGHTPRHTQTRRTVEHVVHFVHLQQLEGGPGAPALLLGAAVVDVTLVFSGAAHFFFLLSFFLFPFLSVCLIIVRHFFFLSLSTSENTGVRHPP